MFRRSNWHLGMKLIRTLLFSRTSSWESVSPTDPHREQKVGITRWSVFTSFVAWSKEAHWRCRKFKNFICPGAQRKMATIKCSERIMLYLFPDDLKNDSIIHISTSWSFAFVSSCLAVSSTGPNLQCKIIMYHPLYDANINTFPSPACPLGSTSSKFTWLCWRSSCNISYNRRFWCSFLQSHEPFLLLSWIAWDADS